MTTIFDEQVEILEEAKETLMSYGVSEPKAFSAGCFGASEETLIALKRTGFKIESSYFMEKSYLRSGRPMPFDIME